MQSLRGSRHVIDAHYDIDNELYMSFLDPYNQYTCGYFDGTDNLYEAQEKKLDMICKKLYLSESDTLLDIGCGWGGLAKYAAEHYGCKVTGLTISSEHATYARKITKGLPVEIIEEDYRKWVKRGKTYSKIITVGMIEHVGYKNYKDFFSSVEELLKDDGIYLLHTIGRQKSCAYDLWINKYIPPGGLIPTIPRVEHASKEDFVLHDLHNFGTYYAKTLVKWEENFVKNWPSFSSKYNDKFYRMWRYYFLCSSGAFLAQEINLWQFVFTKRSSPDLYKSIRPDIES